MCTHMFFSSIEIISSEWLNGFSLPQREYQAPISNDIQFYLCSIIFNFIVTKSCSELIYADTKEFVCNVLS